MSRIVDLKNSSILRRNPFSFCLRHGLVPLLDTHFRNTFCNLEINIGQKRYSSETSIAKYNGPNKNPTYPLDVLRQDISKALHNISGIDRSLILNALESTNSMNRGDLILPLPRIKVADPTTVANRWAIELRTYGCIGKVCAKGPFLQFFLDQRYLIQSTVPNILLQKEEYGQKKLASSSEKRCRRIFIAKHCETISRRPFKIDHNRWIPFKFIRSNGVVRYTYELSG